MHMTVESAQGRVPVTILALHGALDASNFEDVIDKARELYGAGTRYILLDLGDMPFMGSSGLVALHSVVLLLQGQTPPNPEMGWQAFHAIETTRGSGVQKYLKLLDPPPKVLQTLEITGMNEFFEIHTDRQTAIASF
jgi:anti-anti-sigma regulatory factor